jgi:hypothetical protein
MMGSIYSDGAGEKRSHSEPSSKALDPSAIIRFSIEKKENNSYPLEGNNTFLGF